MTVSNVHREDPPGNDLVAVQEIARLAGVTRQAVANWRSRLPDFPKPLVELSAGPVFRRDQVRGWLTKRPMRLLELEDDALVSRQEERKHVTEKNAGQKVVSIHRDPDSEWVAGTGKNTTEWKQPGRATLRFSEENDSVTAVRLQCYEVREEGDWPGWCWAAMARPNGTRTKPDGEEIFEGETMSIAPVDSDHNSEEEQRVTGWLLRDAEGVPYAFLASWLSSNCGARSPKALQGETEFVKFP